MCLLGNCLLPFPSGLRHLRTLGPDSKMKLARIAQEEGCDSKHSQLGPTEGANELFYMILANLACTPNFLSRYH